MHHEIGHLEADAVRHAIAADFAQLPPALRRSLTWDRAGTWPSTNS
ncbi:MAG: hypothetical protein ACR2I1_03575 [Propionibacteriaceae bacterium]